MKEFRDLGLMEISVNRRSRLESRDLGPNKEGNAKNRGRINASRETF